MSWTTSLHSGSNLGGELTTARSSRFNRKSSGKTRGFASESSFSFFTSVKDRKGSESLKMKTAIIGVLSCFSRGGGNASLTHQESHAVAHKYLTPISRNVQVVPILIPALPEMANAENVRRVLNRIDGVLLPGSPSNVHPEEYGQRATDLHPPFDRDRDRVAMTLIQEALSAKIPLMAICRGMQELNVALGGSLHPAVHQIEGRIEHKIGDAQTDPDIRFAKCHKVTCVEGGSLEKILNCNEFEVNSCHVQAVDRLASRLKVEAVAPDGTVEAVSVLSRENHDASHGSFAMGVQWHPEYGFDRDQESSLLFEKFLLHASARSSRRG